MQLKQTGYISSLAAAIGESRTTTCMAGFNPNLGCKEGL